MRTEEEENKFPENIQQHLIKLESKTKINDDELSSMRKDVQAASDRMIVPHQFSGRLIRLFSDQLFLQFPHKLVLRQFSDQLVLQFSYQLALLQFSDQLVILQFSCQLVLLQFSDQLVLL
jgi:hypothetical protein